MTGLASPSLVVDASAMVALLVDDSSVGRWVESTVRGAALFAPELMPFEVGNILRRHALAKDLDPSAAALAHADLVALPVDLYPYRVVADRVWQLRDNATAYDASYIAVAELLGAPLVTLDAKLARSPGHTCRILTYPGSS